MTVQAWIKEHIVPVTIEAVVIATGYFAFTKMPPRGTAGDIAARVLLIFALYAFFSILPGIAIIYGWYTGNRAGAVLTGALPLPVIFIAGFFLLRRTEMVFIAPNTVIFIAILSAICGFAGFCAAQRTKSYLAASIVLTGIWLVAWMKSIN